MKRIGLFLLAVLALCQLAFSAGSPLKVVCLGDSLTAGDGDDQSQRPVAIKGEAFTGISRAELQRMSLQAKAYNQVIRQLAQKQQSRWVDFSAGDLFRNPATLGEDGNHPNAHGYDLVTKLWLAELPK